jgi:hypothetical protein
MRPHPVRLLLLAPVVTLATAAAPASGATDSDPTSALPVQLATPEARPLETQAPPDPAVTSAQEVAPVIEEPQSGHSPTPQIKFFSDVRFTFARDFQTKEGHSQFSLNEVDTLITSELTDKVQVLSEVIYHFLADTNETALDIERLQIRYTASKYLSIRAGRIYIPVSYWNYNFHHVIWFQTAANRPDMHRFEDDGGLLPTHGVGIDAVGRLETKAADFDYTFLVSNGRHSDPGQTQIIVDENDSKAVSFYLMASPNFAPGLGLGGSVYVDKLPNHTGESEIRERILSGYLTYLHDDVELLVEYNGIRHKEPSTGHVFNTKGYYAQLAYHLGRWRPYYRYDRQDPDPHDPYFGEREDVKRHSVGIRWDVLNWNAIFGEYSHRDAGDGQGAHEFTLRTAFTF